MKIVDVIVQIVKLIELFMDSQNKPEAKKAPVPSKQIRKVK